jgi:hypothetical protein
VGWVVSFSKQTKSIRDGEFTEVLERKEMWRGEERAQRILNTDATFLNPQKLSIIFLDKKCHI